ncbi:MAG TPA: FAD-binding protein [Actinomycetota bacterium]|jgi:fumarate reductase flavoprotein subunit|nr:FAD-binding protein [Actinomycetota bacterium]
METIAHDIVIVGGGGAGLRAAIAAAEVSDALSIALVSKVYPMRSHTVSAEGGAGAVVREDDSLDLHAFDTIRGSDWLADQDAVEAFVSECFPEMIRLEHWGCPWSREPDGRLAVRPFGGMSVPRTLFAADKTGFHMLHALFQTSLKYERITRYDEFFVTKLLIEDGRCAGVAAMDLRDTEVRCITGKAVILCTGGAGRTYSFTTNGAIKTGDGMALAYRAGVPLKDMEFVQYHPTGLPGTGILITEAARGEGGYLLNKEERRFLEDYIPSKMELGPRDILSRAIMQEIEKGQAFEGPHGEYVHLDVRHLGEETIDRNLPFVRELARNYVGIDPVHEPIPVRPVVHYWMGGIDTDILGRTRLPGLYAAGEAACVSINGANRLGSNSLSECLVFGARAGRQAAEDALDATGPTRGPLAKLAQAEQDRLVGDYLDKTGGRERIGAIRRDLQAAMEKGAGIFRTEESLKDAVEEIRGLRGRYRDLSLDDHDRAFNTELVAALELGNMLDVAEAVVASGLERRESRGSHTRSDYPSRDDDRFLKHSLAFATSEGPRIEYGDVTITRWPPAEREY